MLMPSIFGEDLFDDFCGFPMGENVFRRVDNTHRMMQTDITENENGYSIIMDLPGFLKDEVVGEVKDGYLTITATNQKSNDQKDDKGKYIKRERYVGTCSRSFYVGDNITENDIKAKFENGVLKLEIPKNDVKKVEEPKYIAIEG
ncbi:MAG: Hsp20/alpha crystallin family protein [Lachnospiraceae bacterium]|nr:Hsp20/alpha crystallin family protein [Lachnospiraceae bacterium]